MEWWIALLWGLAGAGFIEGLDLYSAIRRVKGYPWTIKGEVPFGPYLLSVFIRLAVGAGLAAALGASQQVAGPVGAVAAGVAAPKILEQLARRGLSHPAVEQLPAPTATPPPPATDVNPAVSTSQPHSPDVTGGQSHAL